MDEKHPFGSKGEWIFGLIVGAIILSFFVFKEKPQTDEDKAKDTYSKYVLSASDVKKLKKQYSTEEICRAAVHSWMGSPNVNIYFEMPGSASNEATVKYFRKSDDKLFTYDCSMSLNRVYWNTRGGRFKNHSLDEQTYAHLDSSGALKITNLYSESTPQVEVYSKAQLESAIDKRLREKFIFASNG